MDKPFLPKGRSWGDKRWWVFAAALWGFAEATTFFVVPDVLLTAAVFAFGFSFAVRLAGAAATAAILGGGIMWAWGASEPEQAQAFLLSIPLLGEDLLLRVQDEVSGPWLVNIFTGALTGVPYKIYAMEAGATGINPVVFLAVSLAARFARFALVISLFSLGLSMLRRFNLTFYGVWLWGFAWAIVYALYIFLRLNVA